MTPAEIRELADRIIAMWETETTDDMTARLPLTDAWPPGGADADVDTMRAWYDAHGDFHTWIESQGGIKEDRQVR